MSKDDQVNLIVSKEKAPAPPLPVDARDDFSSSPMSAQTPSHDLKQSSSSSSGSTAGQQPQWPCANCHAMVSEDRCPHCHGIQVKIKSDDSAARTLPEAWIERVSPTTIRGGGTPLSSPLQLPQLQPTARRRDVMSLDGELVELDEDDDEEELEQTSEGSPRHYPTEIETDEFGVDRPNNPVAFLLATAESPLPSAKFDSSPAAVEQLEQSHREELKKQSKDRMVEDSSSAAGKKQRILFAM